MSSRAFERDFGRAIEQQQKEQRYGAGLDAANAEGSQEKLERSSKHRDKVHKDEKGRKDRPKGSRDGHKAKKRGQLGEALIAASDHVSPSTAIRMLAPKDGNRAVRKAVRAHSHG